MEIFPKNVILKSLAAKFFSVPHKLGARSPPMDICLRPLLYLLYTADIGSLLTQLGLMHHLFADAVQAYVHTVPLAAETVLTQMSQDIDVLTSWMADNRLLLNPSKTQAIWLGGHRQLAKIDGQRLSSLFPHITFSTCVRDLGAMLDSELTFRTI